MRCCADSLMSRALEARRCRAWSSWSAPGGCFPVKYLYIHDSTERAARPKPPEVRKPVATRKTAIAAGTSTGLKMTSSGVATVRPMTVTASVSPDRTSIDPPAIAAVTAFTTVCDIGCGCCCCCICICCGGRSLIYSCISSDQEEMITFSLLL
ncbi:unnamed protein product [Musa hybrid cultivar]